MHQVSPPLYKILPLLERVKSVYLLWYQYYQTLPKLHRHSLGQRIDSLFVEIIEAIAIAGFLGPGEKQPWVRLAIRKTETLKILLMVLWETNSLDNKKYIALSVPLDQIGKMLGGWNGQILSQLEQIQTNKNSPRTKPGEK